MHDAPELDLAHGEPVFKAAPVRLAASPGAFGGIEGAAVLTSERLIVVPGAGTTRVQNGDPLQRALAEMWDGVKRAVLEAFPVARLLSEPRHRRGAQLAARSRPGIEIPLELVRRAFPARLPGWIDSSSRCRRPILARPSRCICRSTSRPDRTASGPS